MGNKKATVGQQVCLNAPTPDLHLIDFSQNVHDAMKSAVLLLPDPSPSLVVFASDLAAYRGAQTLTATRAYGAAAMRNATRKTVKNDLGHLRDYVQSVVELQTSFADAKAVAAAAFMSLRQIGKRERAELSAVNGLLPGTVVLDAKAVGPFTVYYWELSSNSTNWSSAPETLKHTTVISGLTSAQVYYFRFRALTRAGERAYSQVVSLLVH